MGRTGPSRTATEGSGREPRGGRGGLRHAPVPGYSTTAMISRPSMSSFSVSGLHKRSNDRVHRNTRGRVGWLPFGVHTTQLLQTVQHHPPHPHTQTPHATYRQTHTLARAGRWQDTPLRAAHASTAQENATHPAVSSSPDPRRSCLEMDRHSTSDTHMFTHVPLKARRPAEAVHTRGTRGMDTAGEK